MEVNSFSNLLKIVSRDVAKTDTVVSELAKIVQSTMRRLLNVAKIGDLDVDIETAKPGPESSAAHIVAWKHYNKVYTMYTEETLRED